MNAVAFGVRTIALVLGAGLGLGAMKASASGDAHEEAHAKADREWRALVSGCGLGKVDIPYFSSWTGADGRQENHGGVITMEVTGWTGGCVKGKRGGHGVYSQRSSNLELATGVRSATSWSDTESTFVDGDMFGLGCSVGSGGDNPAFVQKVGTCYVMNGELNSQGPFLKEPDGRWRVVDYTGNPATPATYVLAGSLEKESERVIALARAGKPGGPLHLATVVPELGDIFRGGAVSFALSRKKPDLKGKRVAILLSSRALAEIERYTAMRQKLIEVSAHVPKKAREYRDAFIAGSEPSRIVASVVASIKAHGATPVPADDLSVLANGGADYAFIFDWRFFGNFALDAKEYAALPACGDDDMWKTESCYQLFRQSESAFLVNSRLEVEHSYDWDLPSVSIHHPSGEQKDGYGALFERIGDRQEFDDLFNIDDGDIRERVDYWLGLGT